MTALKAILAAAFVLGSAATVTAAPATSADPIVRSTVEAAVFPLRAITDEAALSVIPSLQQLARSGGGGGGGHGGNSGNSAGPGHDGHDGPGHDGHDGPGHDGPGHDGPGHDGHDNDGPGHG